MTLSTRTPMLTLRVALARLEQRIGWAGIAGIGLLVAATAVAAQGWSTRQAFLQGASARAAQAVSATSSIVVAAPPATSEPPPDLPLAADIPLLLTRMQEAAVDNGLGWRAAEYRISPSTPAQPASLEVRFNVKGPYPKLRAMLVQLQTRIPGFAVREFSATRPNADTPEVEAKLALAVLLQDDPSVSDASSPVIERPSR